MFPTASGSSSSVPPLPSTATTTSAFQPVLPAVLSSFSAATPSSSLINFDLSSYLTQYPSLAPFFATLGPPAMPPSIPQSSTDLAAFVTSTGLSLGLSTETIASLITPNSDFFNSLLLAQSLASSQIPPLATTTAPTISISMPPPSTSTMAPVPLPEKKRKRPHEAAPKKRDEEKKKMNASAQAYVARQKTASVPQTPAPSSSTLPPPSTETEEPRRRSVLEQLIEKEDTENQCSSKSSPPRCAVDRRLRPLLEYNELPDEVGPDDPRRHHPKYQQKCDEDTATWEFTIAVLVIQGYFPSCFFTGRKWVAHIGRVIRSELFEKKFEEELEKRNFDREIPILEARIRAAKDDAASSSADGSPQSPIVVE